MRLKFIDGLRAFAVLAVVFAHHAVYLIPTAFGVTLFFVISGFVITRLLLKEHEIEGGFRIRAFFARRALKIIPPFLVAISLPTALLWKWSSFDVGAVLSQHFFYYNWYQITHLEIAPAQVSGGSVLAGSQVVWSLAVEEQFYILIALIWFILSRRTTSVRSLRITLLVAFWASLAIRIYVACYESGARSDGEGIARIVWGTDTRLSGIALGGLLAISVSHADPIFSKTNWLLDNIQKYSRTFFSVGVCLIPITYITHRVFSQTFGDIFDLTFQEIAGYLLIATGLTVRGWPKVIRRVVESKPIQTIGLASYSIYLIHFPFKCYVLNTWLGIQTEDLIEFGGKLSIGQFGVFPGLILAGLVSVIPGLVVHQIADVPMERFRRRWRVQSQERSVTDNLTS